MTKTYRFTNGDEFLSNTEAGRAALAEFEAMRAQGRSLIDAEVSASNVLQRAGYNVNARGGACIEEVDE